MRDAGRHPMPVIPRRVAAVAMAAVLAGGAASASPPSATAARPAPDAAADFLSGRHGGTDSDYVLVYERSARIPATGESVWVGKFVSDRDGSVRTVYRDAAGRMGGPELLRAREAAATTHATTFERKASAGLRRAVVGSLTRIASGRAPARLAVAAWLRVDLDAAEAAVRARHPEVTWLGSRPLVHDMAAVRRLRAELWTARRDAIAAAAVSVRAGVRQRGGRVAYVSTSAPLAFLDIDAQAVPGLAELPEVATLGLEGRWQPAMTSAGPAVDANWTGGSADKGAGVRVGVVEYHNVRERRDLEGKVVRKHSTSGRLAYSSGFDHPTWVAGAIAGQSSTYRGVAPGAKIVSSGTGGYTPSLAYDRAVIAAADWAISPGGGNADIVNTSLVQDTATGAEEARRYFDSIAYRDARLAVSAAGNYVNLGSWAIGSPGTGYNVLTVGGVDDRGTRGRSDDRIWYVPGSNGANWLDRPSDPWNAHGDYNKPNLVAPAVGVRTANGLAASGTSVATPIVAGVAAQVLANEPILAAWPEGARAVLMAGAVHRVRMPDGSRNVDHEGVGMISAEWANRAARSGDNRLGGYRLGELTAGQQPVQQIEVLAGDRLRVALAWNSHATGHGNLDLRDRLRADLDLRVTDPEGRVLGSYTIDNAYEFVEVRIRRSGTASIQVLQARFDGASETYGLAWVKVRETTPPRLLDRVPKRGEPWAVPSVRLQAQFSERVQGVGSDSFQLLDESSGERVAASVSYSSERRIARLQPDRRLPAGKYRAVLRASIRDRAGNRLARTSWTFRVKRPADDVATSFETPRRMHFKAGTHVGYRFDGSGRLSDTLTRELERRAYAHVTQRGTIGGLPGTWLLVDDGAWAGFWIRESERAGLLGQVGTSSWADPRRVVIRSGKHVGFRFDEDGRVTARRSATVDGTTAHASRRAVVNGAWHLRITDGRWAGFWLPESRDAHVTGTFDLIDLGGPDVGVPSGTRTGFHYDGNGKVAGERTRTTSQRLTPPVRAWAIINGRPSLYMEGGRWAGYWLPESNDVQLP